MSSTFKNLISGKQLKPIRSSQTIQMLIRWLKSRPAKLQNLKNAKNSSAIDKILEIISMEEGKK